MTRDSFKTLLMLLAFSFSANAIAADENIEAQQRLEDARMRLEAAAREVAELSTNLAGAFIRTQVITGERRAMLGINIAPVMLADAVDDGVEIGGVSPGGPAAQAGLRAGDVLIAIDGQPLTVSSQAKPVQQLLKHMQDVEPGNPVQLRYRRDGDEFETTVTTGEMDDAAFSWDFDDDGMSKRFVFKFPDEMKDEIENQLKIVTKMRPGFGALWMPPGWDGIEFAEMNAGLGSYFGTETGLLVTRAPDSDAVPLMAGDVITRIGEREPATPVQAMRILNSYDPGETVRIEIVRRRESMVLEITIPEPDRQSAID